MQYGVCSIFLYILVYVYNAQFYFRAHVPRCTLERKWEDDLPPTKSFFSSSFFYPLCLFYFSL